MRKCETEDNFRGVSLARLVEYEPQKYWPTVTCQEVEHPDAELTDTGRRLSKNGTTSHSLNLADTVKRGGQTYPTPKARDYKGSVSSPDKIVGKSGWNRLANLDTFVKFGISYPTPRAHDSITAGSPSGMIRKDGKDTLDALNNFVDYGISYPTPGCSGLANGSGNCEKSNRLYEDGVISDEERKSFRAGNGGQLAPDWTEWLMGWPVGWTDLKPIKGFEDWKQRMLDCTWWETDPADTGELTRLTTDNTHRADRLKAIGNGQVPMCVLMSVNILEAV